MRKCSSTAILPCIGGVLPELEQSSLPRTTAAAGTRLARIGFRLFARSRTFGAGTDAAIGKFDLERHPGRDGCRAAERLPCPVAHQRKAARKHATIGKRRQQLAVTFEPRPARGDEIDHRALGALGVNADALATTLDTAAQQMRTETSADSRITDAMDLR